jgi:hypothetical protein|nr:MAG TPA: hypothetical protein [Caudoviricetes sp.]
MTYKEYISNELSDLYMSPGKISNLLEGIKQAEGINPDDEVDVSVAKKALYNSFSSILPKANVSEGKFSVSWLTDNILTWYSLLANELGLPNVLGDNTLKDYTPTW